MLLPVPALRRARPDGQRIAAEAGDLRQQTWALALGTPGIGIHPGLAAVTLAGVYVQLGAHGTVAS